MRRNDKFLAFLAFLTVITFVCVLSLGANDKKRNITYQEGVEEIPGENGEFKKYVYRKDAFYGYASQDQETPRFYNLSYEFKKNHISFKSPQLSEDGHIKGWDLINEHVRVNFDSNGLCIWENLAETPTTGKYYSGSYKDPNTGTIDGFMVDGKGNLLIKVPKMSRYAFLDSEVQKFLQMKTKNGNPQKVVEIKDSAGDLIATLDPATHLATAGPNGMLIGIELLDGYLHLGRGLEYQQLHKDTSTAVRTVVPIGKKNAESKVSDKNAQLIQAAKDGNLPAVKTLLADGAEVNAKKTDDGTTALIMAALNGHTDVVKLLLEKGAEVNVKDNAGGTALMAAAINGHTEVVKFLLENGADINAKRAADGATALMRAVYMGHTEVVKFLLEKGAKANDRANNSVTALMFAAKFGHTEIVKLLLEKGADFNANAENYNSDTALMWAAHYGRTEVVKLLLEKGADVNVKANDGETALYYAAWQDHTEAIKLLLEKGANVNAKTNDGVTALIIAAEMGNTEIVKFLLEKGADVNAKRTTDGKTALDAAKRAGHKDIVQLLEKAGDSSARLIEEASSLLRQNRTTEAVERVKSAVAIDPNSHMPWRALFQVSVSLPKEEETLRCWEEMATLYPSNAYCRAMRAAIFHKYGHLSKVKLEFEKAKAAAPRNPFIYAYIVQVYSGMGQYDAAYEAAKTFRDIGGEKEAEETVALFELMLKAILRQFHAVNLPPRTWELPTSYEIDLEMQSIADAWLVQLCAANLKDQKFILGGSTTAVNFAMPKRWKFLGSKDNPVMYAPGFFIWDGAVVAVPQYGVLVVNGTKVKHVEVVGGISRSRIGEVKDWVFTFEKQSKPE